jgi:uncharacterized membrane protein YfhO
VHQPNTQSDSLKGISDAKFDYQKEAMIESNAPPDMVATEQEDSPGAGTAVVSSKSSTAIEIKTNSERPTLLVLTDIYFPGWTATLDGQPVSVVRTNHLFRGILLPPGPHQVNYSYKPTVLKIGIALAGLCGFIMIVLLVRSLLAGSMKKRKPSES